MKYHFMQDKNMTMTTFAETFRKRKKKRSNFAFIFSQGINLKVKQSKLCYSPKLSQIQCILHLVYRAKPQKRSI
jgi:ribosomal protein L20